MANQFNILDFVFRGALAESTANQSIADNTTLTLSFHSVEYDTNNIFDTVSGTNFVVPNGITKVRFSAGIAFSSNSTGHRQLAIRRGGTIDEGQGLLQVPAVSGSITYLTVTTAVTRASGGDIFTVTAFQNSGSSLTINFGPFTYGMLELIE